MANWINKLNPAYKDKKRLDAEYIAMRKGEPLLPTRYEKITMFLKNEYKWWVPFAVGAILTIIGLWIAYLKLGNP